MVEEDFPPNVEDLLDCNKFESKNKIRCFQKMVCLSVAHQVSCDKIKKNLETKERQSFATNIEHVQVTTGVSSKS